MFCIWCLLTNANISFWFFSLAVLRSVGEFLSVESLSGSCSHAEKACVVPSPERCFALGATVGSELKPSKQFFQLQCSLVMNSQAPAPAPSSESSSLTLSADWRCFSWRVRAQAGRPTHCGGWGPLSSSSTRVSRLFSLYSLSALGGMSQPTFS